MESADGSALPLMGELLKPAGNDHDRLQSMESLRIVPLGGLGEVGKNLTVYEANGEILSA